MTGTELKRIAIKAYGQRGWQKQLAQALGRDVSTVRRWVESDMVPEIVALAVRTLKETPSKERSR